MAELPPLSPATGGLCLSRDALMPADIIVSTTEAWISGQIRRETRSAVSHAMLYTGSGTVLEAIGEGVVERSIELALGDATLGVAYRHRMMTGAIASAILTRIRGHLGKKYDTGGIAAQAVRNHPIICVIVAGPVFCTVAASGVLERPDRFFCSELILEAFQQSGVPIVDVAPSASKPHDIVSAYEMGRLGYMGHVAT